GVARCLLSLRENAKRGEPHLTLGNHKLHAGSLPTRYVTSDRRIARVSLRAKLGRCGRCLRPTITKSPPKAHLPVRVRPARRMAGVVARSSQAGSGELTPRREVSGFPHQNGHRHERVPARRVLAFARSAGRYPRNGG